VRGLFTIKASALRDIAAQHDEGVRRATEARALAVIEQELACSPAFSEWLFAEALAQVDLGLDLSGGARLVRSQAGGGDPVDRILFYDCGPLRVALVTAVRLSPLAREVSCADRVGAELVDARRADLAFTMLLGGGPAMDRFDCAISLGRVGAAISARSTQTQGELALRLNHAGSALAEAPNASASSILR
jgi:hypothetical protein